MVVGFKQLGKTSFIRMLFDTLNRSSTEQGMPPALLQLSQNGQNGQNAEEVGTKEVSSLTFEVEEESEKISLTLVDTPGFVKDNELRLDVQVTEALRYIEAQFDHTLIEVSSCTSTERAVAQTTLSTSQEPRCAFELRGAEPR
jgi:septin family protein